MHNVGKSSGKEASQEEDRAGVASGSGGKDGKRGQKRGSNGNGNGTKAAVAKKFVGELLEDKSGSGRGGGGAAAQGQVAVPEGAACKGHTEYPAKDAEDGGGTGGGEVYVAAKSKAGKQPKQNYVPPRGRAYERVEAVGDGSKAQRDAGDKPANTNKSASSPPHESKGMALQASKDASAAGKTSTPQAAKSGKMSQKVLDSCAREGAPEDVASTSARTPGQRPRGGRGRARDGGSGPKVAVASEGN